MLDRSIQLKILEILYSTYGKQDISGAWKDINALSQNEDIIFANVTYLEEKKLIRHLFKTYINGVREPIEISITAYGIDIVSGNTERIEQFVIQSYLEKEDKNGILDQLRSFPADTIKHLGLKIVDYGLEEVQIVIRIIQKFLSDGGFS